MSVLIKDMEKPKSCYAVIDGESEYCPFVNTDDDCVLLLKKGICEGTWEEQYSKCPLAEEPERKKGKWIPVTKIVTVKDSGIGWPTEHVEWVDATESDEIDAVRCSECREVFDFEGARNWCTECGTDMRGEQE